MKIIINSEGQNFGPYSEREFEDLVKTGRFLPNDLAWLDSTRAWVGLNELANQSRAQHQPQVVNYSAANPVVSPQAPPATEGKGIIINSDGQNYGPYAAEQVREFIRWGIFRMNDFAWTEGTKTWVKVVEILQDASHPATFHPIQPQMVQPMPQQVVYSVAPQPQMDRPSKPLNPGKTKVIIRSGDQKFGPYNLNQVREFLLSGKFKESDLAWSAPLNSWVSLGEILDQLRVPAANQSPAPMAHPMSQPYVQIPTMAPLPVTSPAAPRRKISGASIMNASAKNFGPSF